MKRGDGMSTCEEMADKYLEIVRPYAEEADKEAREIVEALNIEVPKIYETIPSKGLKNRFKRAFYKLIEDPR